MAVDPSALTLTPKQVLETLKYQARPTIEQRVAFFQSLRHNPVYPLLLLDENVVRMARGYERWENDHTVFAEFGQYMLHDATDQPEENWPRLGNHLARYAKTFEVFAAERGWTEELRESHRRLVEFALAEAMRTAKPWPVENLLRAAQSLIDPATLADF